MPKESSLAAVVLAAGKGKRLRSASQKVLHPICGRPALWWVLQNARAARPSKIVIVVHHGADDVREAVRSWDVVPEPVFVEQGEALGTGHAVMVAERAVGRAREVLVLGGDFDPIEPADVRTLLRVHRRSKSAATILTAEVGEPGGYARIVRDGTRLERIVEGTDAPPELKAIREVSLLVFAFRRDDLFTALPLVGRENRQREYYLNEVFQILMDKGERVSAVQVDAGGAMGINSRGGLAETTRVHPRPHQRAAPGGRRHARRPGDHLHRRRRPRRPRHGGPSAHVPVRRHEDRRSMRDRAVDADRRHDGG